MDTVVVDKELFEKVLDSLPFKTYIVDRELKVLFWNHKGTEGIYAVKKEDAIGMPLRTVFSLNRDKIVSPKDIGIVEKEFREVFDKGTEVSSENVSVTCDGEKRYYKVTKSPISLTGEEVTHVATIVEETTAKRRLEGQLIARERLSYLGQMASGIAHQISNPLSTISVCAEALLRDTKKEAFTEAETFRKFDKYLKMMNQEVSRCSNIADLQSSFGVCTGKRYRTDINRLVTKVFELMRVFKNFSVYSVEMVLDEYLPYVVAEESLLSQAFTSILYNAFESLDTKECGLVKVSTSSADSTDGGRGGEVRVAIEDTGCGINATILDSIFTPFFTTKGRERTGLGLYLAHEIIREHGGRIEVDTEQGRGSVFTVILPEEIQDC